MAASLATAKRPVSTPRLTSRWAALADALAQALLRKTRAEDEPGAERVLRHAPQRVAQCDRDDLRGVVDALDDAIDPAIQLAGARSRDRHHHVVLRLEVVVEGAAGHVGGLGDVLDGDDIDAARSG